MDKGILEKHGLTVNKLALEAKINPSHLYAAINGKIPFYPAWRRRVAEVLGVDEAELFDDERGDNLEED